MVSTETHIQVTLYSLSRLYLWLYVYAYKHIHVKIINAKAWFERLLRIYGRALEGKGVWKNDVIIFMISKVKETIIIIINQCDQQQAKKNYFHQREKSPMANASVELVNILLIPLNNFDMVKSNM